MAELLEEAEELAVSILRRMESSEPLSVILPAARRLAEMLSGELEANWLFLESVGIEKAPASERPFPQAWRGAVRVFIRLHGAIDPTGDRARLLAGERTKVFGRSVMELERITQPLDPFSRPAGGVPTSHAIESWQTGMLVHMEAQRVVHRVRQEVHMYVTRARRRARELRAWLTLFGKDAPAVFEAGGHLLDELKHATASLAEPGKGPTAASQARTALLTMGRELYKGGKRHTSPLSGKTFEVKSEINMLHAHLDNLWERAPEDRRPLLVAAHDQVETAYDLGSRAKNPAAVTYEQAEQAVRSTFAVAWAVCFGGGFPLPAATTAEPKS
jgi:hypothetical protein